MIWAAGVQSIMAKSGKSQALDQTGLFKAVVAALQKHPAYLIVFIAILLPYLTCITLIGAGVPTDYRYLLGATVFLAVLALITVRSLEGQSTRSRRLDEMLAEREKKDEEISQLRASRNAEES